MRPLIAAGAMLGCGLGALFDGILLHQVLQWHNLLSSVHPPIDLPWMKYNMLWDGLFHAAAWLVTAVGIGQLLVAANGLDVRWSYSTPVGGMLVGWGSFNVLEGLVDHHCLALHHVHPGQQQLAWDLGFIAGGCGMVLMGAWLLRRSAPRMSAKARSQDGDGAA